MDPNDFQLLRQLFEGAEPLDPADRVTFLEAECGADEALRASVERMLAVDAVPEFLERPRELELDGPESRPLPERIGPYDVLGILGEGGSSVVLRARQLEPIRRTVALKVLRAARIDERSRRRFQAEGDLLAGLVHGSIAQVHDAGEDENGQLYLAMELVEGSPITAWCDAARLSIFKRLTLFQRVVEAVQYSHQNGVVHRDVKAGNVLVKEENGVPAVKLIDFGIARPLERSGPRALRSTWDGTVIGTPGSMSPEQALGAAVDTRTDVYGLGVLLFELLTGSLPLDPRELSRLPVDEVLRHIREVEPRTLLDAARSSRGGLSRCAELRATDPRRLRGILTRDLSWVVRKALAKDPDHRYATATSLGEDVARVLRSEPVDAREPALRYLTARFVRRHRIGVAVAGAAAALTLATIAGLLWALRTVDAARATAETRGEDAARERAAAVMSEYSARLAAAGAAMTAGDTNRARHHLEAAPAEHRAWGWRHLWGQLDTSSRQFDKGSPVHALLQAGPESLLATCEGSLLRLDLVSGEEVWSVPDDDGEFDEIQHGPDEGTLIVDRRVAIELMDARKGSVLRTIHEVGSDVRGMALDPAARLLYTSENAGPVRVHDIDGQQSSRTLTDLGTYALVMRPLADGERLLVGSATGALHVFDTSSGEELFRWELGSETLKALEVEADEEHAFVGLGTRVVKVHLPTGAVRASFDLGSHVRRLVTSPRGEYVYVAGGWKRGSLVRLSSSTLGGARPLPAHRSGVVSLAAISSSGPTVMASGDNDGRICLWEAESGLCVHQLPAGYDVRAVTLDAARTVVATVGIEGRVMVRDARTLTTILDLDLHERLAGAAFGVAELHLSGERLHRLDLATGTLTSGPELGCFVSRLRMSTDGRWLAGVSRGAEQVLIWDLATGASPTILPAAGAQDVVLEDDADDAAFLVVSQHGPPLRIAPGEATFAASPAQGTGSWSSDPFGRAMATVEGNLWLSAMPPHREQPVELAGQEASSVLVLEEGNRILSGGQDDLLRVLDGDGRELLVLPGAPKPIVELVEGPSGRVFGLSYYPGSPSYLMAWDAPVPAGRVDR